MVFEQINSFFLCVRKVVGAVAMDVDVDSSKTNSNSEDPKSEKGKGERKLYVGSQALNYCRDQRRYTSLVFLFIVVSCHL